jgi:predicted aspartyl protease
MRVSLRRAPRSIIAHLLVRFFLRDRDGSSEQILELRVLRALGRWLYSSGGLPMKRLIPGLIGCLLLAGCAAAQNTLAQDLAWERWYSCDRFASVNLQRIEPDGTVWIQAVVMGEYRLWETCMREAAAKQAGRVGVSTVPAPAIVPKTTVTAPEKPAAAPAALITAPVSGPRSSMIPIQVVNNVVLVPATFNGSHGATLLLDTGASYTVITPALAARLNLAPRPNTAKRSLSTAGGQKIEVPFVRLPALDIGNATLVDIEVGVYAVAPESPTIDGLLGADVLSRYRVTVDHSARQLRLDPVPCLAIVCK